MYVAMDTSTLIAILAAIPAIIVSMATLVATLKNSNRIAEVHLSLNSRLSALIAASNAQGRIDQQNKTASDGITPALPVLPVPPAGTSSATDANISSAATIIANAIVSAVDKVVAK